jgi:hypothetical protein
MTDSSNPDPYLQVALHTDISEGQKQTVFITYIDMYLSAFPIINCVCCTNTMNLVMLRKRSIRT